MQSTSMGQRHAYPKAYDYHKSICNLLLRFFAKELHISGELLCEDFILKQVFHNVWG